MTDVDENLGVNETEALADVAPDPAAEVPVDGLNAGPASPNQMPKRFRAPTNRSVTDSAPNVPEGGWRGRLSSGFNRLSGAPRNVEQAKEKVKDDLKNEAKSAVKKEAKAVAKNVAKKAATRLAAAGARAIAVATSEIWGPILLVLLAIVGIIVIIAVIVSIAQSGQFGSSFHQDSDKNTQMIALANAGDVFARRDLDATDIPAILTAMDDVEKQASAKSPKDQAAIDIATVVRTKIKTYSSSDSKVDQQTMKEVGEQLLKLSAMGYGDAPASEAGKKIAALARYYAGDPKGIQKYSNTCPAGAITYCNGFAIRVMHETGLDDSYSTGRAMDQLTYVRTNSKCYEVFDISTANRPAQGDLLFRPNPNKNGFGHVAIYLGNGLTASASIKTERSAGHPPQIGKRYSILSVAARLKGTGCPSLKAS